jgi:hypothetical protein
MRRLAATLTFVALWLLAPVRAQLASPNAMGVSMGHFHYVVGDVEPNRKFWIDFGWGTSIELTEGLSGY